MDKNEVSLSQELYIPDQLFSTNNDMEIPTLLMDVQPQCVEIPFLCFGEQKRTFNMANSGTLHFYTDDYRFTSIFEHPEKVLKHQPANIVEPNFSLFNETPIAFGIQAVYKKRFVARALQERGIGVYVDLNVANKFYAINMLGVPMGYSSFCTRGYSDRLPALEFEYMIAKKCAQGNPLNFVVYGGGMEVKRWCQQHNCVYVSPVVAIKKKLEAIKKMKENVAGFNLFGEDTAAALVANELAKQTWMNQVEDNSRQSLIQ